MCPLVFPLSSISTYNSITEAHLATPCSRRDCHLHAWTLEQLIFQFRHKLAYSTGNGWACKTLDDQRLIVLRCLVHVFTWFLFYWPIQQSRKQFCWTVIVIGDIPETTSNFVHVSRKHRIRILKWINCTHAGRHWYFYLTVSCFIFALDSHH